MNDLSEFVTISDTTLVTDSRRVAKHFKKAHKNILRDIEKLECSDEFRRLNFELSLEINDLANGKKDKVIRITKDGLMLLAMGFTGAEAMKIKESYIKAFNSMADQLQRISSGLWQQMMDLDRRDASSFSLASFGAKRMVERRTELAALENERALLESKLQPALFPGCLLVTH